MNIKYVTSNTGKFDEAKLILTTWDLERVDVELPELQGDRHEIIRAKGVAALSQVQSPLVVEDVSLHCPALGGLPGPYIKDFLKHLGEDGFAALVHKYDDHRAEVICTTLYCSPNQEPIVTEGSLCGKIVPARGTTRHGRYSWNALFVPDGYTQTFGEVSMEEHSKISMRRTALEALRAKVEAARARL